MLTVYGRKSSFNVQKVMWLVGELGMVHKHIELGGAYGGLDTPEFRAMNPHGRVPVVDDNGTIVWESHAILRYLAACYGRGQFWSEDAAQRSLCDRWMDWSQSKLQPDFLNGVFWAYYRTPASQRDIAAVDERSGVAENIFYWSIRSWPAANSCSASSSRLPTLRSAQVSTDISTSISRGRLCQTLNAGMARCNPTRPIARTSWCHSRNCADDWLTESAHARGSDHKDLTISSVIFLASPNSIIVLSR